MTNHERVKAVIHRTELDHVPFLQYDGLAAPNEAVWAQVGRENVGIIRWSAVHRLEAPNCRTDTIRTTRDGLTISESTLATPAGTLTQVQHRDPQSGAYFPVRRFVNEEADYAVLTAYLHDIQVVEDFDRFRKDQAELGDDGLAMVTLERTPYQQMWVRWVGLETLSFHLADCPDAVENCVLLWTDVCRRVYEVIEKAIETLDVDYVNFPDNIAAPVIGRRYFGRYCVPLYREVASMLEAHGLPLFSHMDGELGPLRESIAGSGVRGIDSFTPEPDTENRVDGALDWWPDTRLLVNFPSSVHLSSTEAVEETAADLLEQGGHSGQLALQISEDIPPEAWKTSFPAIIRAIDDFGRP